MRCRVMGPVDFWERYFIDERELYFDVKAYELSIGQETLRSHFSELLLAYQHQASG